MSASEENELVFNLSCLQRRNARKKFRKDIIEAWGNKCAYCGDTRAHTLDHIIPRAKGGSTKRGNLLAACPTCNLAKSDIDWLLWYRSQTFGIKKEKTLFGNGLVITTNKVSRLVSMRKYANFLYAFPRRKRKKSLKKQRVKKLLLLN